jgi:uncharacterized membrane protein HdeD (DUF308 family)
MFGITSFRQLIGFIVASLMVVSGVLILTETIMPEFIATDRLRYIFGVVLILFGVFRFLSAYFSEKRSKELRSIIEDDSWKSSSTTSE